MIQGFYTAATGAQQQMQRMNVTGNNVSNVNTHGFRAEQATFTALMYSMVGGIDGAELPRGSGSRIVATATDFTPSAMDPTGRSQDYAIRGEGFFALYDPATGEISLTRDGAFYPANFPQITEEGVTQDIWYLSDGQGRQVLDTNGFTIEMEEGKFDEAQPVGVFLIENRDALQHLDSSRFLQTEKSGGIYRSGETPVQGYLEGSNVDLAKEIGKIIEAQRSYSYALRMVTTADEVESTINSLTN